MRKKLGPFVGSYNSIESMISQEILYSYERTVSSAHHPGGWWFFTAPTESFNNTDGKEVGLPLIRTINRNEKESVYTEQVKKIQNNNEEGKKAPHKCFNA